MSTVAYDGKIFAVSPGSSVVSYAGTGGSVVYYEVPSGYSVVKVAEQYYKVPDGYYPAEVNGVLYYVPNDEQQLWTTIDNRVFTTMEFASSSEVIPWSSPAPPR